MKTLKEIAETFGKALDQDEFSTAENLIHQECIYDIGSEVIIGPNAIANSYEKNMIDGRKKLDELIWGESYVETLSENVYEVYFTDYLKHKGISHIHRCKQVLTINKNGKITRIDHINLPGEPEKLAAYYQQVGITKKQSD